MKQLFLFMVLACLPITQATAITSTQGNIHVPGGQVWYSILGSGQQVPLLIIHGGPGGSSCSFSGLTSLTKNRPVIVYDQLGAGKSEHPTDNSLWEIHRFSEELSTVITALHLQKVHLLAHSWGAAVAGQYLMDKGSAKIASVIFAGPLLSAQDWTNDTNQLRLQLKPSTQAILRRHELAGTTNSAEYQRASSEFYDKFLFHQKHRNTSTCDENSWNPAIYAHMWGDSEFKVTGNLKNFDVTSQLNNIKIPVLFIVGEFDEVRKTTVDKYQKQMSDARVAVIKDAAHMSMIDSPEIFIATVNSFLNQIDHQPEK